MIGTLTPIAVGQMVRGLVSIRLSHRKDPCPPDYLYTVEAVHGDGTATVYRSEVAGRRDKGVCRVEDIEPAYQIVDGTYYSSRALPAVIAVLERVRTDRTPVVLSYGYTDAVQSRVSTKAIGEDWLEEHDVKGRIGRSCGHIKIPLIVPKGEAGGPAILTDRIVRIRTRGGKVLYKHPDYRLPSLTVRRITEEEYARIPSLLKHGFTHTVEADGVARANFSGSIKAEEFIEFFQRERK